MKSILTLFCAFLTAGSLMAQIPYAGGLDHEKSTFKTHEVSEAGLNQLEQIRKRSNDNLKNSTRGGGTSYWVSYDEALAAVGGLTPVVGIGLMWEDSTARIANSPDPDFYWFLHQFNQNFDPNSGIVNDAYVENASDVQFGSGKIYEVDSMRMYYQYERVSAASVVDTLVVWIYNDNNIDEGFFNDWPSAGVTTDVAIANYNWTERRPATGIIQTYEVPLTVTDTVGGGFLGIRTFGVNTTLDKGDMIGAAWYFKSGQTYALGDVLFDNSTLAPGTLNNFSIGYFEEEDGTYPPSSVLDDGALTIGGVVTNDVLVNDAAGWNGNYIPGLAYTPPWPYEHVLVDWLISPFGAHFISGTTGEDCEIQFSDLSNVTPVASWLWEFGDGAIAVDQSPTHTYDENGSYTVRLEVRDDAGETFGFEKLVIVTNCGVSGINDLSSISDFSVYPNPASEFVNINFESTISQDLEMTVFNIQGKMVYSESLSNVSLYNGSIDVSDMSTGVYYVKLQNGDQVAVQQFMID